MSTSVTDLTDFLDRTLKISDFASDYSNNGLQVEASAQVTRVAFAVDAALNTFEQAADAGAQLLVVHHGISWGGEPRRWRGADARRLQCLMTRGVSLYAVHLPLDAHAQYGNNAVLAQALQMTNLTPFFEYCQAPIGWLGDLATAVEPSELEHRLMAFGGAEARLFFADHGGRTVRRIAVVSGGAGLDGLQQAIAAGADLLVTGEFEHTMYHVVRENGTHVLALGHYASETGGVRALQQLLTAHWPVTGIFLDCPTHL